MPYPGERFYSSVGATTCIFSDLLTRNKIRTTAVKIVGIEENFIKRTNLEISTVTPGFPHPPKVSLDVVGSPSVKYKL